MENQISQPSRETIKRIRNTVTIGDMVTALLSFHEWHRRNIHSCTICLSAKPYHVGGCPMVQAFKVSTQIFEEENK